MINQNEVQAYTTIVTSPGIVSVDVVEMTRGEYMIVVKILNWLRKTKYGNLEVVVNTHVVEDRSGRKTKARAVDIIPSERERVALPPVVEV